MFWSLTGCGMWILAFTISLIIVWRETQNHTQSRLHNYNVMATWSGRRYQTTLTLSRLYHYYIRALVWFTCEEMEYYGHLWHPKVCLLCRICCLKLVFLVKNMFVSVVHAYRLKAKPVLPFCYLSNQFSMHSSGC